VPGVGLLREVAVLSARAAPALVPRLKGPGPSARLNLHSSRPILAGMAKKPEASTSAQLPPQPKSWTIYKVAAKMIWLGTVEAPDKAAAIEKAAQEFKTEAWRLHAVRQR
jgi:hypothetical protein